MLDVERASERARERERERERESEREQAREREREREKERESDRESDRERQRDGEIERCNRCIDLNQKESGPGSVGLSDEEHVLDVEGVDKRVERLHEERLPPRRQLLRERARQNLRTCRMTGVTSHSQE